MGLWGCAQIGEARMREAEAELEGVTWQPQISRMAKALKRPGDEERWNYLARTAIHKNKVRCPAQPCRTQPAHAGASPVACE